MRMTSGMMVALMAIGVGASAQTVDAGRGELALRVPSDYSQDTPTPLVVLLHGYGSSGMRQESYMKFGKLVDSHGFLLVRPDGTQEPTRGGRRFWNASKACCNFEDDARSTIQPMCFRSSRRSDRGNRRSEARLISSPLQRWFHVLPRRARAFRLDRGHCQFGRRGLDDLPAPLHPVHILQIHGTDDATIAYAGSEIRGATYPGTRARLKPSSAGRPTTAARSRRWSRARQLDLEGEIPGRGTYSWRGTAIHCKAGGSSELWTHCRGLPYSQHLRQFQPERHRVAAGTSQPMTESGAHSGNAKVKRALPAAIAMNCRPSLR